MLGSFNLCQKKIQQLATAAQAITHLQWVSCFCIILRTKIHLMRAAINLKLVFMAVFLPSMYTKTEAKRQTTTAKAL